MSDRNSVTKTQTLDSIRLEITTSQGLMLSPDETTFEWPLGGDYIEVMAGSRGNDTGVTRITLTQAQKLVSFLTRCIHKSLIREATPGHYYDIITQAIWEEDDEQKGPPDCWNVLVRDYEHGGDEDWTEFLDLDFNSRAEALTFAHMLNDHLGATNQTNFDDGAA